MIDQLMALDPGGRGVGLRRREGHQDRVGPVLGEDDDEAGFVEEGLLVVLAPDGVGRPPGLRDGVLAEDLGLGLEPECAHHRLLVALRREQAVVHGQALDAARRARVLEDPLDGVVALHLGARLLARRAVARAHLLDGGHAGLDAAPLLRPRARRPHEQPGDGEPGQERARAPGRHQKPIAAPSPRGSAPPRSVPSVRVMPWAWPMRMKKSETGVTLWPMRRSASRVAAGTRLSIRTWSATSPRSMGSATKRGRSMASWISRL